MTQEIRVELLNPHPANREFAVTGQKWEAFLESVKQHGVVQPLLVRPVGRGANKTYEIVAGHRRQLACVTLGIEVVDCQVRKLSDREALELIVVENLEREDLDLIEEARGVKRLIEEAGMAPGEVATRLARGIEWVRTRQFVLDLPEEAITAIRLPIEDEHHLHVSTVQMILNLPDDQRGEAVQLVLHPEFEMGTLRPRQAADVIRRTIVEPRKAQSDWEAARGKLAKEWRKVLAKLLPKSAKSDLQVMAQPWEETQIKVPVRDAEDLVDDSEKSDGAPEMLRWLDLAMRHGLWVKIIPGSGDDATRAVVDEQLIRTGEAARAEHGGEAWLLAKAKSKPVAPITEGLNEYAKAAEKAGWTEPVDTDDDDAVERALAALDGEPTPGVDLEPETETVIEQRMERHGFVDTGKIERVIGSIETALLLPADFGDDELRDFEGLILSKDDLMIVQQALQWVMSTRPGQANAAA